MIATLFQAPYPMHHEAEALLEWQTDALNSLKKGSTDLILLQENCNCTGNRNKEDMLRLMKNEGARFVDTLQQTAVRLNCPVIGGIMTEDKEGILRNQLALITPDEPIRLPYTKNHLVKPELDWGICPGKKAEAFEYRGVRYGAAICFDFYFPELFVQYAEQRIDVMLIVSHQRQEPSENLEFLTRARAFDCGCTLLRVAPAMENPNIGGRSMAVAPTGKILQDAGNVPGIISCEFDPKARFYRPASYGEPEKVGDYREVLMQSRKNLL